MSQYRLHADALRPGDLVIHDGRQREVTYTSWGDGFSVTLEFDGDDVHTFNVDTLLDTVPKETRR